METAVGPSALASGTMLDDKYRIERLLATGGMGAVYLGTHIKLRKRVAIKILNPQLSNSLMIERFHREAITASQIGHEGIAQVTDLGTSAAGEPFLVMEYLEGESLAARLKTSGPLPIDLACELGCAILSPLDAAHRVGIVHRDLKPDNVFLVRQSRGEMVKLLDFGISRATGLETEFRLTTTGLVLGTPYYMSPEQARGDSEVGPAADLYAFGVMLYEMLAGHVPIQGDNYNQLMYRVMSGEFAPPRQRRSDIPPELEHLILRAMAIAPADRPASAAELERALLAFCRPTYREHTIERLSSAGMTFQTSSPRHPGSPTGTEHTVLATSASSGPPRRRSRVGIALGVAVLLGGAAGAIAFALRDREPPPAAAEPTSGISNDRATAGSQSTAGKRPSTADDQPTADRPAPVGAPAPANDADAAAPAPAPAPAPTVTVRFAIEPASATITVDGRPIEGTELVVEKDTAAHRLRITAAGHVAHDEDIRFDENQRLVVQLKKSTRPDRPRPPNKPGKPGKDPKPDRIESESPYK